MVVSFNCYRYSFFLGFRKRSDLIKATAEGRDTKSDLTANHQLDNERSGSAKDAEFYFHITNHVAMEIRNNIQNVSIKKPDKNELLFSVRRLLQPYNELTFKKAYPFQIALNNVIKSESTKHCSIDLSNEDLHFLWRELG